MKPLIHNVVLLPLLAGCLLSGCSRSDPAAGDSSSANAGFAPDTGSPGGSAEHPCQLLTDVQVRNIFPGSAAGKRDTGLDQYGIETCVWETPTDRFVAQMFRADSGSIEDELRSRVSGSVDPVLAGAGDRIRYETVAGVGDRAMLVVEKADPRLGILADTAVLVTQRGNRRVALFAGSALAGGDRGSAVRSLAGLGRDAVRRL